MENKKNIAQLLKECPQGMELDCALYKNATLECVTVDNIEYPIEINIQSGEDTIELTEYGCWDYSDNAKCIIFPKGKTTWEGFVPPNHFKDGDIVATDATNGDYVQLFIFKKYTNAKAGRAHCYLMLDSEGLYSEGDYYVVRHATEEEKAKLFQAIKDNGYRWNFHAKRLEKLIEPKFIKDDKVRKKGDSKYCIIEDVYDTFYTLTSIGHIDFTDQDNWELVPNKFDISTLKSFESRVLVRDSEYNKWISAIWGIYDGMLDGLNFVVEGGNGFNMCIPYEGNEHLLGTTDDCDEFYKTWEE